MKKCILLFIILFPLFATCQENLKNLRQKSWETFAYRITANQAEQFLQWDSIAVSQFVEAVPALIFKTDSWDEDKLPPGNYVLINVMGNKINARLLCNSGLVALTINNKQQLQVDVRTKEGIFIKDAGVFVNNTEAIFNKQSETWWVKNKKKDKGIVKVYVPGDTLFTQLEAKDDVDESIALQKKRNYRNSRLFKILHWFPSTIQSIFASNKKTNNRIGASGYIIFNQAKYKQLDTVKLKGYVIGKNYKLYTKPVNMFISYAAKGKNVQQFITTVQPTVSGSYITEFIVADTIPNDINCTVIFKTVDKKEIIRERFKIEEYVPDEIDAYSFKSDKEIYFKNDSLHFFAAAKDANGTAIMDATATLILTARSVNQFYADTIFVADTLYQKQIQLLATGDTKFTIAANHLPGADVTIDALLIFKNSNNERHEEKITLEYKYFSREIVVTKYADSIKAVYIEDGVPVVKEGEVEMNEDSATAINFPYAAKIDPIAKEYSFYTNENNKKPIETAYVDIDNNYRISVSRISDADTLGFVLDNPYKIPVYFTVFDGGKIVASGKQSTAQVIWKKVMANKRKLYKVRWQYIWAGIENYGEENIGLLYKLLNIKIAANTAIFPGQKDAIAIDVKDYKGKPAADVNLTAVSYNNQLQKDIRVPEPPYLARYKKKNYLRREGFEIEEPVIELGKQYLLGKNQLWREKLHLDSMLWYKLLFPENEMYDAVTAIENFVPQISVSMVDKGVPQNIYLLYINRELVYYNGATDSSKYAFPVFPGFVQLGIRLKDTYIEIDSLYIQPNYKHDMSIDVNNLPKHSKVTSLPPYWTAAEKGLLERSMWQMENNYLNNNAWVWQDNKVVKLNGNRLHIAGPFRQARLQFFNPGNFDMAFAFEPGYRYNLSKQIARLEKASLFSPTAEKIFLPDYPPAALVLGDTLEPPPQIMYAAPKRELFLLTRNAIDNNRFSENAAGMAALQFVTPKDSVIKYLLLVSKINADEPFVYNYSSQLKNIPPGLYTVLLVTFNGSTAAIEGVALIADGVNCIKIPSSKFNSYNAVVAAQLEKATQDTVNKKPTVVVNKEPAIESLPEEAIYITTGGAKIYGTVKDAKGNNAIPFVSINIKGYTKSIICDRNGFFILTGIRPGRYKLVFSAVGYENAEASINCLANENVELNVLLKVSSQSLNEVVVVGYGALRKQELTGSVSIIKGEELSFNMLAGKVAGIDIGTAGAPGNTAFIQLRGAASASGNDKPLYVIDGIFYDELPGNFNTGDVSGITILKDAAAVGLYGARASAGAIIITTKTKTFRKDFRDYALWQPNLVTNKNGQAFFDVTYPDNITSWRTFVVAMDKKRRMGKASILTRAYKPLLAQLNVPSFLTEGDSAFIIGKTINYTAGTYTVTTKFITNTNQGLPIQKQLSANEAVIQEAIISPTGIDTISAVFTIESTTGFKDGEEKKIPVFKRGIEEAAGNFWALQNDTAYTYTASAEGGEVNLYAQNNTLDVLLEELDQLQKYPYYCMEQTASKLAGAAMEKKIRSQLKQPFKNGIVIDKLLRKIQKAQLFTGAWGWWENGKANFYITNYITNTLLKFTGNPLVESNVRNAFLYLQNRLQFLNNNELLTALSTLSEGKNEMNYSQWIDKISFDSLNTHSQWAWVKIKQQQKLSYKKELQQLVNKKISTMTGGIHWGEQNYSWYSNEVATTIIAYDVLKNEEAFKSLTPLIIQYFLEKRKQGHWANTVESASILNAILPEALQQQHDFTAPALLTISGDTNFVISNYPYQVKINSKAIKELKISKSGGGLVYFTAWQNTFNTAPMPVTDKFIINTVFKKNGQQISSLKSGEKVTLVVAVNVLKDADYVMIQVPIPAGCVYADKKSNDVNVYKEFYKNKVMLFAEHLPKGIHQFEIELETRYNGRYTVNPSSAALMYYPTFFGRNGMRKVAIEN